MLIATEKAFIKLASIPSHSRTGLLPMTIAIAVGWVFVCLWTIAAVIALAHNIYWSLILFLPTLAFAALLAQMTYNIIVDSCSDFVVELTSTEAVLSICDRLNHRRATRMILLNDVTYAEYYPYLDSACVILHTDYTQMEIPIWPFGIRGQDIIDFLSGSGVKVVNVQSDEPIPA